MSALKQNWQEVLLDSFVEVIDHGPDLFGDKVPIMSGMFSNTSMEWSEAGKSQQDVFKLPEVNSSEVKKGHGTRKYPQLEIDVPMEGPTIS